MIRINALQLLVHDQDEALDFYTTKVGMEVRVDAAAPGGGFRWLTVGPVGQPELEIALVTIPGSPFVDADSADGLGDLIAKGVVGTLFLETDDCQAVYEELTERGVQFMQPPEERPYGFESGFRDPSGNYVRLTQPKQWAADGSSA